MAQAILVGKQVALPVSLDLGYFFEQLLAVTCHPYAFMLVLTEKTVSGVRVIGKSDAVPFLLLWGE